MGSNVNQRFDCILEHIATVTGTPIPANMTIGYAAAAVSPHVTPRRTRKRSNLIVLS